MILKPLTTQFVRMLYAHSCDCIDVCVVEMGGGEAVGRI